MIDSGLNMRIYGNGWDVFEADMKNSICYPGVAYEEIEELYLRSKIVLGQASHFRNGMHDRIPTAMLAGAAVLTDYNDYLRMLFRDGLENGELCMYDVSSPNKVSDIAYEMLEDVEKLYNLTLRAYEKAKTDFTWKSRAKEITEVIRSVNKEKE